MVRCELTDAKTALNQGENPPEKPKGADAGAPPIRVRIRIADTTTEKAAALLAGCGRGLQMCRDELSGWLGGMDRYNGGGDRPFWLESYGGRSFTVDRKSSDLPIIIERLSIAILGGMQPDKMERLLLSNDDDGLLARFLVVYPNPVPLSRPTSSFDTGRLQTAFERLLALAPVCNEKEEASPVFMHLNERAQDALHQFRLECREWELEASGLMKSHIGKLPGMAVRVATVLALLDFAAGEPEASVIDEDHLHRALHYVGKHMRHHAHRAYGTAVPSPEVQAARRIAKIVKAEGLDVINARDIQRRGLSRLQNAKEIGAALEVLLNANWLKLRQQSGEGRPRKSFDVNPRLQTVK